MNEECVKETVGKLSINRQRSEIFVIVIFFTYSTSALPGSHRRNGTSCVHQALGPQIIAEGLAQINLKEE
ncbi:hypothetical protein HPL003_01470 [Paenibacillus terrae HPL-003]|uniref:Uncharacterized protein n=1 Tax=Paenibacillus terrae (strain HPL-003) TaxID=985665 RepID=G7VWL3_PAETH|nr:hypothetical protein HPL003_01470 [Paenibacillus terrae HPL-003]